MDPDCEEDKLMCCKFFYNIIICINLYMESNKIHRFKTQITPVLQLDNRKQHDMKFSINNATCSVFFPLNEGR